MLGVPRQGLTCKPCAHVLSKRAFRFSGFFKTDVQKNTFDFYSGHHPTQNFDCVSKQGADKHIEKRARQRTWQCIALSHTLLTAPLACTLLSQEILQALDSPPRVGHWASRPLGHSAFRLIRPLGYVAMWLLGFMAMCPYGYLNLRSTPPVRNLLECSRLKYFSTNDGVTHTLLFLQMLQYQFYLQERQRVIHVRLHPQLVV